jgi:hypothetical protein
MEVGSSVENFFNPNPEASQPKTGFFSKILGINK